MSDDFNCTISADQDNKCTYMHYFYGDGKYDVVHYIIIPASILTIQLLLIISMVFKAQ